MKSKNLKQLPDFTFSVEDAKSIFKYIAEVALDLWTIFSPVAFVSLRLDGNSYF